MWSEAVSNWTGNGALPWALFMVTVSVASVQHVSSFVLKNSGSRVGRANWKPGQAKQQATTAPVSCRVSKPPGFLQTLPVWLCLLCHLTLASAASLASPGVAAEQVSAGQWSRKKADVPTATGQLRGLGPAGPSRLNACRALQAFWLGRAKGQEMCSSQQPSVGLCFSLQRERGSRMRKAIALVYSICPGELGTRRFVTWFGNSPRTHLLLAWDYAQAGGGRGWGHCWCLRDFAEAQIPWGWTGSTVASSAAGSARLLLGPVEGAVSAEAFEFVLKKTFGRVSHLCTNFANASPRPR